ncbi:cyanate transporter [Bowmanella sp. Y26]|uniref:cyanate transporter n=1 Tax=Bowmanella yangjiangensis TaxID=2811230 RepID=UPI001BDC1E4E|nr:cyanate transporter [Bowmanella yangjiangensis]MBT1065114.1 cyanate transporter [Bowmanella yangjiangensis]
MHTNQATASPPAPPALLFITILLIALNLRPVLASIGPLLDAMKQDLSISYATAAMLTTLPVAAMGAACFFGFAIAARFGMRRTISFSLLVLALATGLRFFVDSSASLILSALAAGLGIALIQCLVPAIIKGNYPTRIAAMMGFYITAIMAGASLGSAVSPWFASFSAWRGGLGNWVWLAVAALILWAVFSRRWYLPAQSVSKHESTGFWQYSRAWQLAMMFGLGTAAFVCVLAWLAPYAMENGMNAQQGGLLMGYMTLMEVVAGLLFPALAGRSNDRRLVLISLCLLQAIGFFGLMLAPHISLWFWATLLGLGVGGMFPMVMIVTMDHQEDPIMAGKLAAFVQGIGYLVASIAPWVAGIIRDQLASFDMAWLMLAVGALVLLLLSLSLTPSSYAKAFSPALRPCTQA